MNPTPPYQKNIVYGNIHAGGKVHIGDAITINNHIYRVAEDFKHSILFLKVECIEGGLYALNLSIKSKHATAGNLAQAGENLLHEAVKVAVPTELMEALAQFQTFRRNFSGQTRYIGTAVNPSQVQAAELELSKLIFQTFFAGDIGQVCADFIGLLAERRIEELLLAIASDDEHIINLPFEMSLPHFFPLGKPLAHFGLVRTKTASLTRFEMQGKTLNPAPLKLLFITALPEDLAEGGKMLQIEEEQTRLIRAIGVLEATGDKKPKIVIEFLENASLTELNKALTERHHDIVHISGHGAYKADDKKGVLYFENDEGDEQQITGTDLGEVISPHGCVKLVILSACETAIAGTEGGVTEQLAAKGIPTIVAMRFAVTDEGAKVFTTALYSHLAKGDSVTQALAYARKALEMWVMVRRQNAPQLVHNAEWFTPVVYQNQYVAGLIDGEKPYRLPDDFYPLSSFLRTKQSRLIGEGFIGRKGYLIQMRQAFRAQKHVVLQGLGGLGKTTLAEAFAHNYDNHSHEVLIFRNGHQINEQHILSRLNKAFAKKHPDQAEEMQEIMDNPQVPPTDKLQALIDNYLRHRRTILIFDNFEDVQQTEGGTLQRAIGSAALAEFMTYLCENTPADCHLIFTTRYTIEDVKDTVRHIPLGKMGYAEQYRLLNYSEILRGIPLAEREEVYKRLDGHPRSYEFLETLIKKDKTFHWAQVSQVETDVFENLLLQKVYERLTPDEQHLFQVASVFFTTTLVAAFAHVYQQEPSKEKKTFLQRLFSKPHKEPTKIDVHQTLTNLSDWSLLFLDTKKQTFDVHRLTREWMQAKVTPAVLTKEYALKAGEYFYELPTADNCELAVAYFALAEAWADLATVSFRLEKYYQLIGLYQRAFELNQAVLAKDIDAKTNGRALNQIGVMLHSVGQYDAALPYFEQSLVIDQQLNDRQGEGTALNNISQIHHAKGNYDTALRYLEQALTITQQIGDRQVEGTTLNNISQIHHAKGDYDNALRYLEQDLAITQQIGNRQGEGIALNNISQIHRAKGDYDTALRYLEQSLTIKQQIGNRKGESVTLNNISQIHHAKGDYDNALRYLEQDLAITQQIGDRQGEGVTLNNISQIYHTKGNYDTALRYLEQSLAIQQQIGDRQNESVTLNNISRILYLRGDVEGAMTYSYHSLQICQAIGDINGEAITLHNMGTRFFKQERYDEAVPLFIQAYQIWQKIGSPNARITEGYLNDIIERIGEARYRDILSKMG